MPRYSFTWDPELVLTLLHSWGANELLMLKQLSFKLTALLALCQPKRVSELAAFSLAYVEKSSSAWIFHLPHVTKTRKPGTPPDKAVYAQFLPDPLLCPVLTLVAYTTRTTAFRSSPSWLLLSYRAPHKPISAQTISRWLTSVLAAAGIDTSIFKAHSTRGATSSKAVVTGYPVAKVLQSGCWSNQTNTFALFYYRSLADSTTYSTHILRYSFEHAV